MLRIHSVEITNICNLSCGHCPSKDSKYPRGMMTLKMFEKTITCAAQTSRLITISGFGEPLLHPQIEDIFAVAKAHDILIAMPTNGLLLTQPLLDHMLANNLWQLDVSIHNEQGLAAYKLAYEAITALPNPIKLIGNLLQVYEPMLQKWADKVGVTKEQMNMIQLINVHNWARNERPFSTEENAKWQSKCKFLEQGVCVVRWDGRVNTCCADSEGTNYVGHIDDCPNLTFKPEEYKLCYKCSPAWFTGGELGVQLPTI
jgi:MoaA/NifB/PqqE/SkfB family radical SAM enzyme